MISRFFIFAVLFSAGFARADSVAPAAADNSVIGELASFEIADGYEVTLFADETDGIANPIAMRWGPKARLWVLCSLVYPQIVPTEVPGDKIYILEDADGDGRADKSTVFVDGLNMPTGFAIGDGGVYVGEGQNLVFLKDTDGDDRADFREEVLSGFGTDDTHQNINSFTWSPDGELLFCQGLHAFGRVETPHGIVRMDEHGVWRYRPRTGRLHAFRGCSGQNPWGLSFGQWGEPFAKGNNQQVSELLPVMVHTEHRHRPLDIGATQIKSMICEIVDAPAMPEDLQGDMLIAGYFGHLVDRLDMSRDGSGHKGVLVPPLIKSSHRSFRPVDIRTGPDGAIYVADWFNPIIGHYQASLRHPDRDEKHGRIWRIKGKGRPLSKPIDLSGMPIPALLDLLKTESLRERERVREELSSRDSKEVVKALDYWVAHLDPNDIDRAHHQFEALAVYAWHESPNKELLFEMHQSRHPGARAFATRLVGRWHDRIPATRALLKTSAEDEDARVRLEAVVAASYLPDPDAIAAATRVLDKPMDRFLTAALTQTAHALKPIWWPALSDGGIHFSSGEHLAFILKQTGDAHAAKTVRGLIEAGDLTGDAESSLTTLLAKIGAPDDLAWLLGRTEDPVVLSALADTVAVHGRKPSGHLAEILRPTLSNANGAVRAEAIRLAGVLAVTDLTATVMDIGMNPAASVEERAAAMGAIARLNPKGGAAALIEAVKADDPRLQVAGLQALCVANLPAAAKVVAGRLPLASSEADIKRMVTPFMAHQNGVAMLAGALSRGHRLDAKQINWVQSIVGSAGRFSAELEQALGTKPGIGLPLYSEEFVKALSKEVTTRGNAEAGAKVFALPALSCSACHKLGAAGGFLGPELSAVGAGVPVELMIEAVLWPKRQVKEGFLSTTVTTRDNRVISGYVDRETKEEVVIRDAATGKTQTVAVKQVASREDAGTLMPPGLTSTLTREQLRDLIKFLSEQKG